MAGLKDYFDERLAITLVIVFLLIVGIIIFYNKYYAVPAGGITEAQFKALPAADQANYVLDTKSGYYVKKSAATT